MMGVNLLAVEASLVVGCGHSCGIPAFAGVHVGLDCGVVGDDPQLAELLDLLTDEEFIQLADRVERALLSERG